MSSQTRHNIKITFWACVYFSLWKAIVLILLCTLTSHLSTGNFSKTIKFAYYYRHLCSQLNQRNHQKLRSFYYRLLSHHLYPSELVQQSYLLSAKENNLSITHIPSSVHLIPITTLNCFSLLLIAICINMELTDLVISSLILQIFIFKTNKH